MSPQEFKAWMEGFCEGLDGAPNEKQWKKIQQKIKLLNDAPVQIVRDYRPYWYPYWYTTNTPVIPGTIYSDNQNYKTYDGINTVTNDTFKEDRSLVESYFLSTAKDIGRTEYEQ